MRAEAGKAEEPGEGEESVAEEMVEEHLAVVPATLFNEHQIDEIYEVHCALKKIVRL